MTCFIGGRKAKALRSCVANDFGKMPVRFPSRARLVLRMKDDQHRFLSLLGQLPARLTAEQAGWVLNCQPHDIPALISARLLKPLGNPAQNSTKFFARGDFLEITKARVWLFKVSNPICQHWKMVLLTLTSQ